MTMNRPLVLLAGFCLVLLMARHGKVLCKNKQEHTLDPESDLSKRGPALEAKLQTNPLIRAPDSEFIHVERRSCIKLGNRCTYATSCCSGVCKGHWYTKCV